MAEDSFEHFKISTPMLKMILKIKNINQLVFEEYDTQFNDLTTSMNPLALFMYHLLEELDLSRTCQYTVDRLFKILNIVLDVEFSMQETPECITSISLLLWYRKYYIDLHGIDLMCNKFIESGVNLESSVLLIQIKQENIQ
jgi:hypothetical protein